MAVGDIVTESPMSADSRPILSPALACAAKACYNQCITLMKKRE